MYKCESCYILEDAEATSMVGIVKDIDEFKIITPYGFLLPKSIKKWDKYNLKKVKIFIKSIDKALKHNKNRYKTTSYSVDHINKDGYSLLYGMEILLDYIKNGQYKEYENYYKKSNSGKIDFKRTIKSKQPLIYNNSFIYTEYISKSKKINDEDIVKIAQGNIINHFLDNIGYIVWGGKIHINIPKIKLNKNLIIKLKKIHNECFITNKKQLLAYMIKYIENLEHTQNKNGRFEFSIIGSTLWEEVVRECFGNQRKGINNTVDKSKYGKRYCFEYIDGRKSKSGGITQHDAVYETDDYAIIIDAKLYKSIEHLLSEQNLGKQFGYYEEAKKRHKESKEIYNILILPVLEEINETNCGFLKQIIPDPHHNGDYNKVIFIYKVSFYELMNNYTRSKKLHNKLISDFEKFLNEKQTKKYLQERGFNSSFIR